MSSITLTDARTAAQSIVRTSEGDGALLALQQKRDISRLLNWKIQSAPKSVRFEVVLDGLVPELVNVSESAMRRREGAVVIDAKLVATCLRLARVGENVVVFVGLLRILRSLVSHRAFRVRLRKGAPSLLGVA